MKILDLTGLNTFFGIDGPDSIEVLWEENYFQVPFKGYNGFPHSEEAKEKIRKSKLGKSLTSQTKQKLSKIKLGSKNSFYNKTHTEEAKEKQRKSKLKYKYILKNKEGKIFITYNLKMFCKENNLCNVTMNRISNKVGKNRTCKGWTVIEKVTVEKLAQ